MHTCIFYFFYINYHSFIYNVSDVNIKLAELSLSKVDFTQSMIGHLLAHLSRRLTGELIG